MKLYDKPINIPNKNSHCFKNNVMILNYTSLEAVEMVKAISNSRSSLLDFASATTPGGGVLVGSKGQEETLCRLTTLYFILNSDEMREKYYNHNRRIGKEELCKNSNVVYVPAVKVIKSIYGDRLTKECYFDIDVIVCAAPNFRSEVLCDDILLEKYVYKRACNILLCAKKNNCKNIILGAHGCGAFKNPIRVVAKAYLNAVSKYGKYFENIVFAIPDDKMLNEFKKVYLLMQQ